MTRNSSGVDIPVISEVEGFNGLVVKAGTEMTLSMEVPQGLKVFTKDIISKGRPHIWIGLIDEDASL